ncbi:MAG: hypothetical protein VXZ84_10255 [Planctomycetota bacterium]|nr:hypothetical protein [Planctomycetota bacterium]
MHASIIHAVALGTVCLCVSACTTVPQQEGLLEAEIPHSKISSRNLRAMVSEYVPSYAHKVEATADMILAGCEDPETRKNALLWKINGISAAFGAASRPDPLASFCDLWVLTRQMRYLAESGEEPPPFGDWQQDVIATCLQLDKRCIEIDSKLEPNLDYIESFVEKTARQHPMEDLYFDRTPIATENIEKIHQPKHELLHVLASMQDDVKDMQRLSALYAEYLPKQARWQAELLALGVDQSPAVREALADFNMASQAMQQLASSADAMQNTVDAQLAALPEVVDQQRIETTRDLKKMQAQAMSQIRAEREAVMLAVHREQEEIRKWVEATALASADRADVITRKRVTQSATVAERLLDRAASYGAALLAIAGFLGVLFGAWFRLIHRRIEKITVINHHDQTSETQLLDQSTVNRGRRNAA